MGSRGGRSRTTAKGSAAPGSGGYRAGLLQRRRGQREHETGRFGCGCGHHEVIGNSLGFDSVSMPKISEKLFTAVTEGGGCGFLHVRTCGQGTSARAPNFRELPSNRGCRCCSVGLISRKVTSRSYGTCSVRTTWMHAAPAARSTSVAAVWQLKSYPG